MSHLSILILLQLLPVHPLSIINTKSQHSLVVPHVGKEAIHLTQSKIAVTVLGGMESLGTTCCLATTVRNVPAAMFSHGSQQTHHKSEWCVQLHPPTFATVNPYTSPPLSYEDLCLILQRFPWYWKHSQEVHCLCSCGKVVWNQNKVATTLHGYRWVSSSQNIVLLWYHLSTNYKFWSHFALLGRPWNSSIQWTILSRITYHNIAIRGFP